ncbi:MAG: hypothetical protein IJ689_04360 [Alphaproteobacteria bacterium]|nr:hypothetical protein [Alphaproteobacteria bacterium]
MIYNKREYKAYVRSLFADASAEEFENYEREIKDSDKKRKMLQKQIGETVTQLKTEQDEQVLIELNEQLEKMRAQKAEIIPAGELSLSRFAMLSEEAKKYACTSALLNKYLTLEIVKNNPLKFPVKENGDVVVDIEALKESHLHELAVDIRDFVHNYMEAEGKEKVTHANYFLDIYTTVPTIYDLNHSIDKYYDKARENMSDYTASRHGIKTVERFPKDKLQLVRMMTSEALDFESNCMGHCIRRDRYVEKINTTAEYYSLRSDDKGKPFYPCATMYFDEGKLVEVVGKSNHAVSGMPRIKAIRSYLRRRFELKNDNELMSSNDIPHIDDRRFVIAKRNLGFIPDKNGTYYDLYNMPQNQVVEFESCPITAHNLDYINKENIATKTLWLQGNWTPDLVEKLNKFRKIDQLTVAVKFNFGDVQTLDLSKLKGVKRLSLSSVNLRKINKIIFPKDIERLEMGSVDFSLIPELDFRHCYKLRRIEMRNSDLRKTTSLKMPPILDELDCSYAKASPEMGKRLNRLQTILKYKAKIRQSLNIKKWLSPLRNRINKTIGI